MENEKNNKILNELTGIHFWISIIGFYFLMKIIITTIKITIIIALGMELKEIMLQLISL